MPIPGYEAFEVDASSSRDVTVDPGARLTLYTAGVVSYAWVRGGNDPAQTWQTTTGPAMTWPVDVPASTTILRIVNPSVGSPVTVRISVNSHS